MLSSVIVANNCRWLVVFRGVGLRSEVWW